MVSGHCTKCGASSGKSKWCTACKRGWARNNRERVRASQVAYAQRFKSFRDSLKNRPCVDCGRKYHPRLMDFDHVVAGTKERVIGRMQGNFEALVEEVAKCDLLCLMCHRARTQLRRTPNRKRENHTHNRRQKYIAEAKKGPCALCGKSYPPWQMDLDHMHDKVTDMAAASRKLTEEQLKAEIEKCRLLCALCHRAFTFGVSPDPLPLDVG